MIGAGSWGTALAKVLCENDFRVNLWARRAEHAQQIAEDSENSRYLEGIRLPDALHPTSDLRRATAEAEIVLLVVPSHSLRGLLPALDDMIPEGARIVNASKGIENGSLKPLSEVLTECLGPQHHGSLCYLSGPSFALEVARGIPTAVSLASHSLGVAEEAQRALSNERFRVYSTDDVVGVEIGGAMKNVIAIASGFADGSGLGQNSKAALITRGLAEIGRLATKLGAHPLTLSGLAGMGDLVLTCTGKLSRNRHVGEELARGRKLDEILSSMSMIAEGVRTTRSAWELSRKHQVEMPITEAVYRVLYENSDPHEAVSELMKRSLRHERDT